MSLLAVPFIFLFWLSDEAPFLVVAVLILILNVVVLLFFRDPERRIGEGIISPADGRVTSIERSKGRVLISIFMNVNNVHVNRAPFDCHVIAMEHIPGGYVPAFRKDSDHNERVVLTLGSRSGRCHLTQIAGTVARRIVTYVEKGDALSKGQRIGLIRFGSRVDLDVPFKSGMEIPVRVGDRVKAGTTTLLTGPGVP